MWLAPERYWIGYGETGRSKIKKKKVSKAGLLRVIQYLRLGEGKLRDKRAE